MRIAENNAGDKRRAGGATAILVGVRACEVLDNELECVSAALPLAPFSRPGTTAPLSLPWALKNHQIALCSLAVLCRDNASLHCCFCFSRRVANRDRPLEKRACNHNAPHKPHDNRSQDETAVA